MDVSAFTLATTGMMPEEGTIAAPGTAAVGGDAFAKLMSGLGIAPAAASGDAVVSDISLAEAMPAEGEAPPVDPSVLLTGHTVALVAPKVPKGEGAKPQTFAANDEREPTADTETPTPASLGLPPLLAALVAPTLAQAAPSKPIATVAADQPAQVNAAAETVPTIGGAVLQIDKQSPARAPENSASLGSSMEPSASTSALASSAPAPATITTAAAELTAPGATNAPAAALPKLAQPASDAPELAQPAMTQGTVAAKADAAAAMPVRSAVIPEASPKQPAEAAPVALLQTALPAIPPGPRRASLAPPGRVDLTEPAKLSEKASAIADIASPLAARPLPAMAPLPMLLDGATAPASTPLETTAPAEQIIEHQLDMAHEGEWLDQLTRDIVRTASAEGGLRFRLNPENLGSLHVEVTQGQAGAAVRLTADTEQARTIIADARPQLIAEARAQGLRISEAHVDLNGQGHSQTQSQAGNGGRSGRDAPAQEYLTSWQPESVEDKATPSRRSTAERYA